MNRLPRELVDASGISFARLGDIVSIPAYKLRRAASGECVLTPDEYQTVVNVLGVYSSNRRRADAVVSERRSLTA
jgi:hypothetical protein